MNTKQAFQKVKTLTVCEPKPNLCAITDPESFAKELNTFYARFDTRDFSAECEGWLRALPPPDPEEPAPFREEEDLQEKVIELNSLLLLKHPRALASPSRSGYRWKPLLRSGQHRSRDHSRFLSGFLCGARGDLTAKTSIQARHVSSKLGPQKPLL
ncbi:hypothetical protein SKAU_G00212580 [Synaphobranchus kaupii]|uniref:Uncharacterized protein n=1 Tax=Synaphobranchus kaupii TaxID=118154 RepID=A0A9Q1F9Q8_SYNKA|nr:hypothetical protein SKAU_G00212580 [Synaphobranchus kaupii]